MGIAQAAEGKIKLGSGDKELRSFGSGGGYDSLSRLALARTRNLVHYEANFLPSLALIISCVATLLLQKWIGFSFLADGRWGRMAADELVVVVERH